jgi:Mg-chelatase subunit ChlD
MKPFLLTVMLLAVPGLAFAQSGRVQATPTPEETLKVVTEEIKLNVLAFDNDGNFFRDVSAGDIVITENNVLHQPASVRRIPANVLIVMDTGGELRVVKTLERTRQVAAAVVNALASGDSIAVMQYADKAEIVSEWSTDRAIPLVAIARAKFGRRSLFVDALKKARDFLLRNPADNRHLVLITDGTDSLGRSSAKFDALQELMATDISVHVISYTALESADIEPRAKGTTKTPPPTAMPDEIQATLPNGVRDKGVKVGPTIVTDRSFLRRMRSRQADLEASQEQLSRLSESTNGEFILPATTDEMLEKAPLVARMIDAAYVVSYMPKVPVVETRGVAERNIYVTSKRAGLIVQARRKLLVRAGD